MKATRTVAVAVLGALAATLLSTGVIEAGGRAPAATSCPDAGDTGPTVDGFPGRMSTLVGADMRTGRHECYERVVLELGGSGDLPGYSVAYETDPVHLSPSDQTVAIAGGATLVFRVGAWMTNTEGAGYRGSTDITPTNVSHILELRLIEDFEGQSAWAIGLDQQRNFTVSTLFDPTRIIIDIAVDPGSSSPALSTPGLPATR